MKYLQTRTQRLVLAASAIVLLAGSGIAYAEAQKTFTSGYEFQVVDPAQPIVSTSVNGTFINHDILIDINLSSYDGVKQLNGTYSVFVQVWNDTSCSYVPYQTLDSNQTISLTPTPVTLHYTFTTDTPANYNVSVEFNTTSYELGHS